MYIAYIQRRVSQNGTWGKMDHWDNTSFFKNYWKIAFCITACSILVALPDIYSTENELSMVKCLPLNVNVGLNGALVVPIRSDWFMNGEPLILLTVTVRLLPKYDHW